MQMIEQLRNKVRESVAKKMKKSRIMIPDMVERETERFDTLIVPELFKEFIDGFSEKIKDIATDNEIIPTTCKIKKPSVSARSRLKCTVIFTG